MLWSMMGTYPVTTIKNPNQGEIWWVNFNPKMGAEISKIRPAVVVSSDDAGKLPLRIVVPLTDWKERYTKYPWFTKIEPNPENGLHKTGGADGFQVKSMSCDRFSRRSGKIRAEQLEDIIQTIIFCLGK